MKGERRRNACLAQSQVATTLIPITSPCIYLVDLPHAKHARESTTNAIYLIGAGSATCFILPVFARVVS